MYWNWAGEVAQWDSNGVPWSQTIIEHLFDEVKKGELDPSVLKMELDRWGIFKEYENRFFRLFGK